MQKKADSFCFLEYGVYDFEDSR